MSPGPRASFSASRSCAVAPSAARLPAQKAKTPAEAYKRLSRRGQRGQWRRAVRCAGPGDALELDVDPEVPPRGLRHRAQQLSRRVQTASARRAVSNMRRRRRQRARRCSRGRGARAAADAPAARAVRARRSKPARRRRRRPRCWRRVARVELQRGKSGGWGYAGLGEARGGRQEPRLPRSGAGPRERRRLRTRGRARRQMSRKPRRAAGAGAAYARAGQLTPAARRRTAAAIRRRHASGAASAPASTPTSEAGGAPSGASSRGSTCVSELVQRGAADAGEPVRRRAGRGRGVGPQALGQRAPLFLAQGRRGVSSTA